MRAVHRRTPSPITASWARNSACRRPHSPLRWVLDPIDGTRAFITGRPEFGTLIALLHDGVPVLGIIDQPVTGERWIGVAGEPTRFRGPFGGTLGTRALHGAGRGRTVLHQPRDARAPALPRWQRLAGARAPQLPGAAIATPTACWRSARSTSWRSAI